MQSATFCREKARVSSAAALRRKLLLPPKERRASKEAAGNSPDLRCGLSRCCPPDCELLPMQLLPAVELCSCSSAETPPHATAGPDAASVPSSSLKPRKSRVFSTSWNTSSARPITPAAQEWETETSLSPAAEGMAVTRWEHPDQEKKRHRHRAGTAERF